MVLSIARQSIILKCQQRRSVLVGNYEFYYAAGLLNKIYGLGASATMQPLELFDFIVPKLEGQTTSRPEEEYLIKIIKIYEPLEAYDQQMQTLFEWGANETDLWQVTTSVNY